MAKAPSSSGSKGMALILVGVFVIAVVGGLALSLALRPGETTTTTTTTVLVAPMWQNFSNLYTTGGTMGGGSMSMMDSSGNMVEVSPTQVYQSYSCSLQPTTAEVAGTMRSTSIMTCLYLGSSYSGVVPDSCNLGGSIMVNGEAVPDNSCVLQRTD